MKEFHSVDDYHGFFRREIFLPLIAAFSVSLLILGAGVGLSMLMPKEFFMVTVILSITTLGIIASLIPAVNRIKRTFELGMYFILIFSLVVASMADIRHFNVQSLYLFYYVGFTIFGSLTLHVLLAKIFRVDADTTMITSVALIFSPPFVPVLAGALKNRQVIISGLAIGILGYALGNYLGVLLAYMLK